MQGIHTRLIVVFFLSAVVLLTQHPAVGAGSLDDLAAKTVESMTEVVPAEYDTIAFWQIGDRTKSVNMDRLTDELEIAIVNSKRFTLINRVKLNELLKEIHFTHSGLVDPAMMKELGELKGVRALLYGKVVDSSAARTDTLGQDLYTTAILKLVSTRTSHVVWAEKITGVNTEEFKKSGKEPVVPAATKYDEFGKALASALDKKLVERQDRLVLDFLRLEKHPKVFFDSESFLDGMVVALTNSRKCRVVDRTTLDALFKEQNLVLDGIVSKEEMSQLARLWSVEAFIDGNIWEEECTEKLLKGKMNATEVSSGTLIFSDRISGSGEAGAEDLVGMDPEAAMAGYNEIEKQLNDVLRTYRPTSETVLQLQSRLKTIAEATATSIAKDLRRKSSEYQELTRELRPTTVQARQLLAQITAERANLIRLSPQLKMVDRLRIWAETFKRGDRMVQYTLQQVDGSGNSVNGNPESIAFSPDGTVIAIGYNRFYVNWRGSTVLVSTWSGNQISEERHNWVVKDVTFSNDGKSLLTAFGTTITGVGKSAELRQIMATPNVRIEKRGEYKQFAHKDCVFGAAFSPDQEKVVTASRDGTVCVWKAATGELLLQIRTGSWAFGASFSPDGKQILIASHPCTLWNAATGKKIRTFGQGYVHKASLSPDGNLVVTASLASTGENEAFIWDAKTAHDVTKLRNIPKTGFEQLCFSPDGKSVLGVGDGYAALWNVGTGEKTLELRDEDLIYVAAISQCGRFVVTCSVRSSYNDSTTRVIFWYIGGEKLGE